MFNPQLNSKGNLNHLLSIEGLSKEKIIQILDTAESFLKIGERDVKKVPILRGKQYVMFSSKIAQEQELLLKLPPKDFLLMSLI